MYLDAFRGQVNTERYARAFNRNLVPLDEVNGYQIRPGFYLEYGAVVIPGGVSFTVHSQNATAVSLVLFEREKCEPFKSIPFPETYRIGNVYSMIVFGLDIEQFEYAFSVDGPRDLQRGLIFDKNKYLLDPYSKAVTGQSQWGTRLNHGCHYKSRVVANDFDWGKSQHPMIPMDELIIYELHVRGYTRHGSSGVRHAGTFAGLAEKIPYLLDLGINAVELMPIFEFDELRDLRYWNGERLLDYWGYNPVSFFAPNTGYTASIEYNREGVELKSLIRQLHEHGIEVILDVVFNHTAEGNEFGPYISFKGFDNNVYYMLTPDGKYYNFSGCGNTLNCNHPIVQQMILDCLRYWVTEYRVDGFRFDLASILGRNEDGSPMSKPPLLQSLAFDPILARVKLIAEAWDAGGLYQVGSFPSWNRWSEWNGKFRDDLRCFLKGDSHLAYTATERIAGSHDLYDPVHRGVNASVNFITCHDGFTLHDLYTFNTKHNEANGWQNTDGENHNNSWNCGVEGETDDAEINRLRQRLIRNAAVVLLASQGTPMLLAGDEFGNTQFGNNNPYCQDNEISWLDWSYLQKNADLYHFFRALIRLRKNHPVMRKRTAPARCGLPPVSRHGAVPYQLDSNPETRLIGVLFAGQYPPQQAGPPANRQAEQQAELPAGQKAELKVEQQAELPADDIVYLVINAHWEKQMIWLPELPAGYTWRLAVNTALPAGRDICADPDQMPRVESRIRMESRSVMLLIGVATEVISAEKGDAS